MSSLLTICHLTSTIIPEFVQTSRILSPFSDQLRRLDDPLCQKYLHFNGAMVYWIQAKGRERLKVRVEIDTKLAAPEVVVRVPAQTAATADLVAAIRAASGEADQLTVSYKGTQQRVAVADILFCEASGHQVVVHTATAALTTRVPLHKLATDLPATFLRASKSAILNGNQVASLSKSLTGNLVRFRQSHKQLYVSRRYYAALKQALARKG